MLFPIEQGFDWKKCFINIEHGEWYLVVFRSKYHHNADQDFLHWLDQKATEAAQQTPGFLYYFNGVRLPTRESLSFCLWNNREAATRGAAHLFHRMAKDLALMNYEYYQLERYRIYKKHGNLIFTPVEC